MPALLQHGPCITQIAEHLDKDADRNALARTSRRTYRFADAVLYCRIDVVSETIGLQSIQPRLALLLRTLQANPRLAINVRHVKTGLIRTGPVDQLIRICRHLRTVQWDIRCEDPSRLWLDRLVTFPILPTIPASVRSFAVFQDQRVAAVSWTPDLVNQLEMASGVRTLHLSTNFHTASLILAVLGPQLQNLELDMSSFSGSPESHETLESLIEPLSSLQYLRMPEHAARLFDDISLPSSLQRLTIETMHASALWALCERLTDLAWCPNLQHLPSFRHIILPTFDTRGHRRAYMNAFKVRCNRAQVGCAARRAWCGSPDQFEDLARRMLAAGRERRRRPTGRNPFSQPAGQQQFQPGAASRRWPPTYRGRRRQRSPEPLQY